VAYRDWRMYQLLTIPGVNTIVSFGQVPAEILAAEIEPIRRAMYISTPVNPHPYLARGEKATIATGPLAGVSGFLAPTDDKKQSSRLVLTVELMSKAVAIEMDAGLICKLARAWNPFRPVCREEALTN
jgi:transcription antitermination factor NusG